MKRPRVQPRPLPKTPRILPPEERPALLPFRDRQRYRGRCVRCGVALPKRKRNWCGSSCMAEYYREVGWTSRARLVDWRNTHPCASCGRITPAPEIEVDHRIALALGGTNAPENLQLLCRDCHKAKTAADMAAMAQYRRGPPPRPLVPLEAYG